MKAVQYLKGTGLSPYGNACEIAGALAPAGISALAGISRRAINFAPLAALLFVCAATAAQQPSPTAHDLAARVDRHYNQLHSLKANFTETYEGLGMSRSESGILLLLKPGRMRWVYSSPPGKLFLLDGSFAWFYAPGDAQVQRIASKDLDDLRSPMRLLLGHTKLEKELDNLAVAPASAGQFTLSGIPKGLDKRVERLCLTVREDGTITAID